jgi:hypothetical protein
VDDIDLAVSALLAIDPGCPRDQWIKVGMAAKCAGISFDVFLAWCREADNFGGEGDCRTVWRSFDVSGGITAATLFDKAIKAGWKGPTQAANQALCMPIPKAVIRVQTPAITVESTKAIKVWELCTPARREHPYLLRKSGVPDGLRIYPHDAPTILIKGNNVAGWLAVPCWLDGKLQTIQFIPCEGEKLNLSGAQFGAGYFVVGDVAADVRLYVVEGIGQAWAVSGATGAAAVVCFGSGRMKTVAAQLRAQHPSSIIVLVPDRAKEAQAAAIAAAIGCKWCELPADLPANHDANDYAFKYGAEALAVVLGSIKSPPMRFNLLSAADLYAASPMQWMVRGVLPIAGLAALYGPSGSGKSFLVLDIAAAVASGADEWFGRRVMQRPVTYCALEGEAGIGKRLTAWSLHNCKPVPDNLRFVTQEFDLLYEYDVLDLAKAVQSGSGAGGLIILDTLNRAAPGADENSSVDMGNIIAAAKRLQNLTGGLVLLVHHTGKDATKGLRGHSSLYAALDGAIEVSRNDSRREWRVSKSKDDETGTVHAFKLDVVTVGHDDDGEEITSCVATLDDSCESVKRVKLPVGGNQKIALDTLGEPLRNSKDFNKDGAPHGHPCIRLGAAVCLVSERLICETKRRTERAQQTLNALVAKGIYGVKGDWLWRI